MGVGKLTYKHFATVQGKVYEVETYQEFKTVWSAAGTCEGGYIATIDGSEAEALRRWEGAACSLDVPRTPTANRLPVARTRTEVALAAKIEEAVTAIRLEAERHDLGTGTIVISAQRLRHIMRGYFLG
jgi:hypothetical protein